MQKGSKINQVVLFDWGDTLMHDDPSQRGPMCDWPYIHLVAGARQVLEQVSQYYPVYVATDAKDSTEREIARAFERGQLDEFIDGYFCRSNLGVVKGSSEYFSAIADQLEVDTQQLIMIGDNLEKDIRPAIAAGAQGIWLHPNAQVNTPASIHHVTQLEQILDILFTQLCTE
ncbi:HAD family hydrolase [Vibrio sp. WXL210]|uniref:HAD family hydrolase n=1 Tax=Vibrio sp. WXL210 TaxID=3450709 RepID=UPI003EC722C8